ncbi:DUF1453 family protein [Streptomyces durmitorensis]|uniref:DUF1453 domain-containing protein n=1 Tax=Streptomyces durmitorensis TaxID=319947 RepID=A0ABY4PRG7_9ACTN|nr:DUF1453 domain-containing protein [Streptomyces durmitorensis]UQT55819.1 DUF1453 domain-containing protein [Streptomyces durmitorensis]
MSGLANVLVVCAVVALVIVRQFKVQQITSDRRWWVIPAVLVFLAVREPDVLDPHHQAAAVVLLGAELLVGLAIGFGWARTTHVWTAPDGSMWGKGTKATAIVWGVGIALRLGLFGIGALMGVRQGSAALMLALAATLLVRSGMLAQRAGLLRPAYGVADAAYEPMRKDPV